MAEFEKRLACVIAADGSIARGYMIDRCELVGANEYVITWKVPLQKEAKTNFSCVIGSAEQEMVEPGFWDHQETAKAVVALLDELFTVVLDGRNSQVMHGVEDALGRPARDFSDYARNSAATGIWRA